MLAGLRFVQLGARLAQQLALHSDVLLAQRDVGHDEVPDGTHEGVREG